MTHIDDENIKKIIKENVGKRKIKLNSDQIITRYHAEQHNVITKPRRFSTLQLKIGLSFLSAFLVIGSFIYLSHALSLFPSDTSNSDPVTSTNDDHYDNKVADGKEGEFIFMVTSSLHYVKDNGSKLPPDPRIKFYSSAVIFDQTNLEATLDETLPLIEEFYQAKKGYKFQNQRGGAYHGKHGTYPNEYVVNDSIRIVLNVIIEDDTNEGDTEIFGEIIVDDLSYRIYGEKQGGKEKGEINFALKVEYSDDAYLQIFSKNNRDEQIFTYHLVVDGEEILLIEIESYRRGQKNNRLVGVDVVHGGISYRFEIEYRGEKFFIEYGEYLITAIKNENNGYEYFYESLN